MGVAYATVAALKGRQHIPASSREHDAEYSAALLAASADIDERTGRTFVNDPTEPRIFRALTGGKLCLIDDARGVLTVEWTRAGRSGPWSTMPGDIITHQAVRGSKVVDMIEADRARFPTGEGAWVRVTPADGWGWADVPAQIIEATLLQAARLFKRRDTPEGISGFADTGAITVDRDFDRTALALIRPFCRVEAVAP